MRLLIVDGNNLACRLYHSHHGNVDVIRAMLDDIDGVRRKVFVSHVAVVFDNESPTFRHELFPEYKAGRKAKDESLVRAIEQTRRYFLAQGNGIKAPDGYEADDVIGTMATKVNGRPVIVYSGDRDLFQLVNATTSVMYPCKDGTPILDSNGVLERMGVAPGQIPCYKGLAGDGSDSIPGVPGIGDKTAVSLLSRYWSIEGIYDHLDDIEPRWYAKLKHCRDKAEFCRKLATVETGLELGRCLGDFRVDAAQPVG